METPHIPNIDTEKFNKIKEVPTPVINKISEKKQGVLARFPLLFTLLGAFGLVATFYGFEGLIDKVDLFANNPFILLATGVLTLIFTGTLYKRLG